MSNVLYATGSMILLSVGLSTGNFPLTMASMFFLVGAILAIAK